MQVQLIESNRDGKNVVHDGHSYNQKQTTINCIHSRCTKYYKFKCPAILKTKNETVIKTKGSHIHDCYPSECKAEEVVNKIKRAQYSLPTVAIANERSDDYAVQLVKPKKDNLLRAVSRKRQKLCVFKYLPQLIAILNLWKTWSVDGIFKLSPEYFVKVYTSHVELLGFAPP